MTAHSFMLSFVMLIGLAGCGGLGGAPVKLYVLGDAAVPIAATAAVVGRPALELKTVQMPDYLDNQDILIRGAANEVVASPTGRWAERLSIGATRALAADLAARLPAYVILSAPPAFGSAPEQIHVDLDAFDARADGRVYLSARWSVTAPGGDVMAAANVALVEPTQGQADAAIAAAMSRILSRLADAISASVPR
jgi:uncharacterized lipoprotein YmbA